MNSQKALQLFILEAEELMEEVSHSLVLFEKQPLHIDHVHVLFRCVHTLKGNAKTTYYMLQEQPPAPPLLHNLLAVSEIAHCLESVFSAVRDQQFPLSPLGFDLLFKADYVLNTALSYLKNARNVEVDYAATQQELLSLISTHLPVSSPASLMPFTPPASISATHHGFYLELDCSEEFKHAYLTLVFMDVIRKFDEKNLYFSPSLEDLKNIRPFSKILLYVSKEFLYEEISVFLKELTNVAHVEPIPPASLAAPVSLDAEKTSSLRVPIRKIDIVLKNISDLVILNNKLSTFLPSLEQQDETEDIQQLKKAIEDVSQTVDALQNNFMKIRMTPLTQLFSKLTKDIRNIAAEANKKVMFSYSGGETEIDKFLLDELFKPFVHLIRNAVHHGIESEQDRLTAQKEPTGTISLTAKYEKEMVHMVLEDDGQGINIEKIKQNALEKKLLTPERAETLSHQELINLCFLPGISTAEVVTEVAGRGVGMDAVLSKISDELKGSVSITSETGKGTKIIIQLPLTLTIIPAMLVTIHHETYAIPVSQIEKVVSLSKEDIKHIQNKQVFFYEHHDVQLMNLHQFLQVPAPSHADLNVVIVKSGAKLLGLTVDDYIRNEDIVIKPFSDLLPAIPGLSGCNILGDGTISLILDINGLFKIQDTFSA